MGYEVYREREDYRWVLLRTHAVQRLQKNHQDNDDKDEDDQRIDVNKNIRYIWTQKNLGIGISQCSGLIALRCVTPWYKSFSFTKKNWISLSLSKNIGLASVSVSVYILVLSHNDDTDGNNDNDKNDNDIENVSENNVDNETCKYRSWRAAGDSEIIWAASLYLAFIFLYSTSSPYLAFIFVYLRLLNICLLILHGFYMDISPIYSLPFNAVEQYMMKLQN